MQVNKLLPLSGAKLPNFCLHHERTAFSIVEVGQQFYWSFKIVFFGIQTDTIVSVFLRLLRRTKKLCRKLQNSYVPHNARYFLVGYLQVGPV